MKTTHTSLLRLVAACLSASACTHTQTPSDPTNQTPVPVRSFNDQGVSAQNRISKSLQTTVVSPTSRECWARLQGEGAIATNVTYRKEGGSWAFEKMTIAKSTLPKGQESVALACLQAAAKGSSFPVDESQELEKISSAFVVHLGWPVPWPPEGGELSSTAMARISSGGGGLGDISGCSTCVSRVEYPYGLKCESRTSGGEGDCIEHSSNVCSTAPQACLRGLFGGSRGVIMF